MTATDKEERIRFLGVPIAVIAAADHHAHTGEDDPAPAQPGCGQAQLETERPAHSKIPAIIRQIHAIEIYSGSNTRDSNWFKNWLLLFPRTKSLPVCQQGLKAVFDDLLCCRDLDSVEAVNSAGADLSARPLSSVGRHMRNCSGQNNPRQTRFRLGTVCRRGCNQSPEIFACHRRCH